MPCDFARDAHGHVLNRQTWTVGHTPVVTLYLSHPGILVSGHTRPPNGFFYKHLMCPSGKAGVTLTQKATNRLQHRKGGQFAVKIQQAAQKPNANAWAQPQPGDAAAKNVNIVQFANDLVLDTPAYQNYIVGPEAAQWPNVRTSFLAKWNANAAQQANVGAVTGWLNQAINANFAQNYAARVRAALLSHVDPLRARAGMSWNDKYGDVAPPNNTVLVLSDDGSATAAWQPNTVPMGCQPISCANAGDQFATALTAALGGAPAYPAPMDLVVDFHQSCVMDTQAASFSNTMHIQAFALSATDFDIYHLEP